MTDFIHEHPKDEAPAAPTPPSAPAEEAPLDEKTGQKRVYGYIFILFIVAFSLLLWSFLMNQRSNEQVISELRGSTGTLQSTLDRNVALEQQVEALEAQVKTLTEEKEALEAEKAALEASAAEEQEIREMLDRDINDLSIDRELFFTKLLIEEGKYRDAAVQLTQWYTAEDYLRETEANDTGSWNDSDPPVLLRPYYEEMVKLLSEKGYLTVGADGELSFTEPSG